PPTKKEQRRLDEQARVERERIQVRAPVPPCFSSRALLSHRFLLEVQFSGAERTDEAVETSKKGKKGKKKGKKGRGNDDDDEGSDAGGGDEETLSRGMESLSVGGGEDSAAPKAAAADSDGEDDGQKRRMSKKERKKAKLQVRGETQKRNQASRAGCRLCRESTSPCAGLEPDADTVLSADPTLYAVLAGEHFVPLDARPSSSVKILHQRQKGVLRARRREGHRKKRPLLRLTHDRWQRRSLPVVKSILEDLDDAEYYGSDHEERAQKKRGGGGSKETVEEELARLIAAAEAGGKTPTARQRKKILQEIEDQACTRKLDQHRKTFVSEGAQFGCSQTAVTAGDQQWANSLDVTIEAFSISAHDKTLFKDSPLQVVHGRKYGLVGPNGAGKSTLLKMIASGELKIPPRIDCLYVEQEVVADDTPAVIAVMKADKARQESKHDKRTKWSLMEEERKVNRLLRDDPENDKLNDRLQQVHEELHTSGGDGAEAQARRILFGLGFDDIMQVKATKHFSGGWRMRISLARALFMEPTLLMLDEPTNHLDLNAVIWLDDYLQKWKKTLLVVSHDQDFLNSVCEEILHLDHQRVNQYKGNYDQFKEMEAQKRRQQAKEWEKQQRRLTALKKGGQSKGKAEETVSWL
ncbi:unnamed protein product, partial [Scytosiphon promiscuus]